MIETPKDWVTCGACGGRRLRKSTRTLNVPARVWPRYREAHVTVGARQPICRRHNEVRVHAACCGEWVDRHLTIPCGAIEHFHGATKSDPCQQCHHAAKCCGADGTRRA